MNITQFVIGLVVGVLAAGLASVAMIGLLSWYGRTR